MSVENYLKDLMGQVLQIFYVVFLGVIIAAFCGFAIDTFYTAPKAPKYPTVLQNQQYKTVAATTQTPEEIAAQKSYDEAQAKYLNDLKPYNQNASVIAIILAAIVLALSLTVLSRWEILANGSFFGGTFTMAYSLILGLQADDARFRFILVTAVVLITIALGYVKFIRPGEVRVQK